MTRTPIGAATVADPGLAVPLPADLAERLATVGLPALVAERTRADRERVADHLSGRSAVASRAAYTAWLRRQATAWRAVRLPAVDVAVLDWPLSSVRPQCLDVVGLIVADLRELDPRHRPAPVPAQPGRHDATPVGAVVAAALLCVHVAELTAPLLPGAEALHAGVTATGPATRYLGRCAELAERAPGLDREVTAWAANAPGDHVHHAVLAGQLFAARLAEALDATEPTGW